VFIAKTCVRLKHNCRMESRLCRPASLSACNPLIFGGDGRDDSRGLKFAFRPLLISSKLKTKRIQPHRNAEGPKIVVPKIVVEDAAEISALAEAAEITGSEQQ